MFGGVEKLQFKLSLGQWAGYIEMRDMRKELEDEQHKERQRNKKSSTSLGNSRQQLVWLKYKLFGIYVLEIGR